MKQLSPKHALFLISLCLSLSLYLSSECLGSQQTLLSQLCAAEQSVNGDSDLVSLLYWPLQQLHQYSRVLLKLAACYDVVRRKLSLSLCGSFNLHFYLFFTQTLL